MLIAAKCLRRQGSPGWATWLSRLLGVSPSVHSKCPELCSGAQFFSFSSCPLSPPLFLHSTCQGCGQQPELLLKGFCSVGRHSVQCEHFLLSVLWVFYYGRRARAVRADSNGVKWGEGQAFLLLERTLEDSRGVWEGALQFPTVGVIVISKRQTWHGLSV